MTVIVGRFGAIPRDPQPYEQRYALAAAPAARGPLVIGLDWMEAYNTPVKQDGVYWIGLDPTRLGKPQGGHAMCCLPRGAKDIKGGWDFYNQGATPQCVGYSGARMQAINNRVQRYDAPGLYAACKARDGYRGPGTYIETAMAVLHDTGLRRYDKERWLPAHGIREYRWAGSVEEILRALGEQDRIALLQSWGKNWPRVLYLPAETLRWLWARRGNGLYVEAVMATDKAGPK